MAATNRRGKSKRLTVASKGRRVTVKAKGKSKAAPKRRKGRVGARGGRKQQDSSLRLVRTFESAA